MNDPYRRLAAAVVVQAISDLGDKQASFEKRLEAMVWLALPETKDLLQDLELPDPLRRFKRAAEVRRASGTIHKKWRQ